MRRYEAMPDLKKAELIEGRVYIMSSPVSVTKHARPDFLAHAWIAIYELATPGVEGVSNATTRMGRRRIPQPDAALRLLPTHGGKSHVDKKDYLKGPPELVIEIAASSASVDLHEKLKMYRRAQVLEYLVWRTRDPGINWLHLEHGKYVSLQADAEGIIRSRIFPGLWLDVGAMLKGDKARVISVLKRGLRSREHAAFVKRMKNIGGK